MVDLPEGMENFINDYKIHIFEVAYLTEEQVKLFRSDFRIVADYFVQKRKNKKYIPGRKTIRHVDAVLKFMSVMTGDRRFINAQKGKKSGGDQNMCEILDQIENRGIQKGMEIMRAEMAEKEASLAEKEAELCERHMGKYPVIMISLKDVTGASYEEALKVMSRVIKTEARRHQYLLESNKLTEIDKESLRELYAKYLEEDVQQESIRLLSEMLNKHYGKGVIILIDEYDVPLDKAYQNHYYTQMVHFIRSVFSQALKTNKNLEFAVITGCLRIARESIFTGLNHFKIRGISDVECAEYFGFTDDEVRTMMEYYGVEDRFSDVKEWYDGYHFGAVDVYCPWDVINQCDKLRVKKDAVMEPHWENSSSNAIVQDILSEATETTKAEIEVLISGGYVEKQLLPELTYTDFDSEDIDTRQTYLWSALFSSGYLTDQGETDGGYYRLVIPNREVLGIYEKKIRSWFKVKILGDTANWKKFCMAVRDGEAEIVEKILNKFMADSISIRDTFVKKPMKENYYHGMLFGLLKAEGRWIVKSNAESGTGYTDIKITIPAEKIGCVIELKYAEDGAFDFACREAMKQIEDGGYATALIQEGMQTIHKFGIACYKKTCKVIYRG